MFFGTFLHTHTKKGVTPCGRTEAQRCPIAVLRVRVEVGALKKGGRRVMEGYSSTSPVMVNSHAIECVLGEPRSKDSFGK